MAIDRNLNLIYTIDRGEDPAPRVFAIPVGQAIFDIYYRVLARTYVEIYGDRLQIAGAKIAVNMLRDVAKATPRMDGSGTWWEGPDGVEAGFLGVMLFGRERVGPALHAVATLMVALGTFMSAFWILSVNSWMQTPQGYSMNDKGQYIVTSWLEVIFNPSFPYRLVHMVLAAYLTTAFVVGAVAGERVPWVDEPECVGCNLCQLVCPVGTVTL